MTISASINRSVVVATRGLNQQRVAEVRAACERVGAGPIFSDADTLPLAPAAHVLVGGLGAGERRIPSELKSRLDAESSNALLLLCEDTLVSPSVSLHRGRVALLGAEADAAAIASRLWVLFAALVTTPGEADECATEAFWARVANADTRRARLWTTDDGSLSLFFAVRGGELAESTSELALVREGLGARGEAGSAFEHAVDAHLPPDVGVVHYSAASREWFGRWPESPKTLWMLSPQRIPALSDLSRAAGSNSARLRAESSDLLVALPEAVDAEQLQQLSRDFQRLAHLGGPAVFELAGAAIGSASVSSACVVELR